MVDIFHEGGPGAYLALMLGLSLVGVSIAYLVTRSTITRNLSLGGMAGEAMIGLLFWLLNRGTVERAAEGVDPSMRDRLLEVGYREAARPPQVAFAFILFALIFFGLGEYLRRKKNA
jgi:hypothetical protein